MVSEGLDPHPRRQLVETSDVDHESPPPESSGAPFCGTGDGSLKPEAIILQDSMVGSIEYLGDGGKEMTILNGRKSKPTLEKDGFELLQLEAPLLWRSEIMDGHDPVELEDHEYERVAEVVKRHTFAFRQQGAAFRNAKAKRVIGWNVWTSLDPAHAVQRDPLALLSAASLDPQAKFFPLLKAYPRHEWHYFPNMTNREAILFKQWDSDSTVKLEIGDASSHGGWEPSPDITSNYVYHQAVDIGNQDAPPRRSADFRCLALYY
ncbi:hypothetical protein EMIHUDRAFT_223286 [Emiliania huxleyi CCMP1516]|uniref:Uncharacterized protein n=2 Tax=Emiliania huxleyi TaxID=2903 RepID=A0A0D3KWA1_EMIH1|nr:hypothetical protein EMIHUDRAFT_223286 [Emiliania huxleyi CCMP1516]EOD40036.1 hypothetical protein EMIHUDRAFT_223286 [Emiliania huxleyi CCMP1516]|eukprot:XP_005792465.1 hypothetical protein EMIHUDRAFT_223286 [Emiliania huxleyi CCMP1516]